MIWHWSGSDRAYFLLGICEQESCSEMSAMLVPRRYSHFVFGIIQSGLTSAIASAMASIALLADGRFLANWLPAWLGSWLLMLPVVILAAPFIRRMALALTRDD